MSSIAADVRRGRHAHRYLNLTQTLVYKLLFAHLGKFIIVAVYFVLTQWMHGQYVHLFSLRVHLPQVKQTWDSLFSADVAHGGLVALMSSSAWNSMRHIVFRGLLEGVLGMVLFRQIGFNVEKYRAKIKKKTAQRPPKMHWYNTFFASPYQTHPVTARQYLFLPVLLLGITIVLGVPLYLGVHYVAVHTAHWLEPNLGAHQSLVQRLYLGDYDGLIIGVLVGIVAGRSYQPYLFANTMNYGRSWVARGRGARWWMPKPTRDLIRDLCAEGVEHQQAVLAERHSAARTVAAVGVVVALGLAIYGWYILQYVAR